MKKLFITTIALAAILSLGACGDKSEHKHKSRNRDNKESIFSTESNREKSESDEKVAAVANKTQTTRTAIKAIVNRENSQIIFIDTPGIHKPKSKLSEIMLDTAFTFTSDVDIILFVIDGTSSEIGRGDTKILEKLKEKNKKGSIFWVKFNEAVFFKAY